MTMPKGLQEYAARLGVPESESLGRIFSILFDGEDDVKVIEAMPGTAAELAERTGLSGERVQRVAERLRMRGAVVHPMRQPGLYRLCHTVFELRDATVLWPEAPQELFELWEKLITNEISNLIPTLKKLYVSPMLRILPVERSVESQNTVLDIDSAREIFRDAELITAAPCACRVHARRTGRGADCPAPETSLCMQTNGFAKLLLSRGLGEEITYEEALKRVADAEEAGLVHMTRNNVKEDMFMCNCCSCCCTALYLVNQTGYRDSLAPSRFSVKLNADACTGCGICEDRCQFHAISVDGVAAVDSDKCFGCGNCVITCPDQALILEEVRPEKHIRVT